MELWLEVKVLPSKGLQRGEVGAESPRMLRKPIFGERCGVRMACAACAQVRRSLLDGGVHVVVLVDQFIH